MTTQAEGIGGQVAHYGPRSIDQKGGGKVDTRGLAKQFSVVFDATDLPAYSADNVMAELPAGCQITGGYFEVITAFTSTSTTTDLDVGIADADGGATITDPNGLFTAAELTQTVIGAANVLTPMAGGALYLNDVAEAAVITVTPNVDDLLTGRARIVIEYIEGGV